MATIKMLEYLAYQVCIIHKIRQFGCFCVPIGCTDGELRLVGGVTYMEGRVEICLSDEWGTVCGQIWDEDNSIVVCRQLGWVSAGMKMHSLQ